jgi:hypothetical protein
MECRPEISCTNTWVTTNRETRALNRAMAVFTQWRGIDLYLTAQLETARALCCYFGPWLIHYALCQPWLVGRMNTNKDACGGSNRHSHTNRCDQDFFLPLFLLLLCVEKSQVPRRQLVDSQLVPPPDPHTQHSAFSPPAHTRWRPSSAYYLLNNLPPYGARDKSRQGIARTSQN